MACRPVFCPPWVDHSISASRENFFESLNSPVSAKSGPEMVLYPMLTSDPPLEVRLGRLRPPFIPNCQDCAKLHSNANNKSNSTRGVRKYLVKSAGFYGEAKIA